MNYETYEPMNVVTENVITCDDSCDLVAILFANRARHFSISVAGDKRNIAHRPDVYEDDFLFSP